MTDDFNRLGNLIQHAGVLVAKDFQTAIECGHIARHGKAIDLEAAAKLDDHVMIYGNRYRVIGGGGQGRLQIIADPEDPHARISGPVRVHAGQHKCLTEYTKQIYRRTCNAWPGASFRHFYHRADAFYADSSHHSICSLSGQAIDLDRFDDIRVVRVVRDPRDLLVSSYFYHKRAAEHWCALPDPTDVDWMMVNGCVPEAVPQGHSLSEYLNTVSVEDGLLAEIEFRRRHFESMRAWPKDDPRVRLYRYEDVVGREVQTINGLLTFLGVPLRPRMAGVYTGYKRRAARMAGQMRHIRNPASGQWRAHFTDRVTRHFEATYGDLLTDLGYSD